MFSEKKDDVTALKNNFWGSTGQKIRRIRERKGVTAPKLAGDCKLTKSAVSLYENGIRQVSDEKRKAIADALGVSEGILKDHQLNESSDIIFALFEMEEQGYIKPITTENGVILQTMHPLVQNALAAWSEKNRQKQEGEISQEEYDAWKDSFFPEQAVPPEKRTVVSISSGSRAEEIRSLQMLRQTMEYDIDQVEYYIDKDDVLGILSAFKVLKLNLLSWLDRVIDELIEKNS